MSVGDGETDAGGGQALGRRRLFVNRSKGGPVADSLGWPYGDAESSAHEWPVGTIVLYPNSYEGGPHMYRWVGLDLGWRDVPISAPAARCVEP